ncbi:hypothetical protein LPJ78_000708 [Coemansia sp. RSA 989]|nr:hypothetical protein BX667DRAFT_506240 [Coemansia mojavensis]KAJ1744086.1 hypothetical protein LPJ68_000316 [Coemansia sp. RSA 1086]KAJ1752641.1 hypothetical protein LPJ79_001027 [Coemansia sp. RSA 1821]KAJ1867836.1 hypothetical protein LPJ78_000708 [Coemansia sp. RSA 989]KAJ1874675.1 hypothetical protein LPJ55_001282 [Coemansia sp. RSA 990]KAJ2628917.1 hypothetical protein H4R22_003621 [Coemansia sp. RSA 1290]KAJ2651302.1 hypothetical protein IWW40_001793 [Coemansia sp. RSA 1250]KAJ26737
MTKRRTRDIACENRAAASEAGRPIAIISTRGPSVLSAVLAPPQSRLRRTSLLAGSLRLSVPQDSDAAGCSDSSAGGSSRKRRRHHGKKRPGKRSRVKPWTLLVADIASGDLAEVREALQSNLDARCLVEFCGDQHPCLMTLCQDGFVWNQEAFIDRQSRQFEQVARRNPFMHVAAGSSQSALEMVQLYPTTVHEIRREDCPRLF